MMTQEDGWADDPLAGVSPIGEPHIEADAPPQDDDEAMRSALRRAAGLPLNDYGNGQRFVTHFGRDFIFVPRVGWFIWSGSCWIKDDDMLAVRRSAQRLSDLILREMPYLAAGKDLVMDKVRSISAIPKADRTSEQVAVLDGAVKTVGRHRSFATTTGNSARIDNAAREAGVDLAVAFEDLDSRALDVNTESGVLRFSVIEGDEGASRMSDVTVLPHEREQHVTKIMPVRYDPGTPCDRFDAFLERVQPDPEMRGFLQRWFGLSMTGLPMQRLVFFYGGGANGKSVLVELVARIMGNYAATARIESLTGSNRRGGGDATPDLIPLMGARMVRTSEPDEGQRLQEGLIKELTGGEPIQVRALHSDFIEMQPVFKLTMSGNHKPEIRGTDDGIWRRMMVVPFDEQIPEAERDPELVSKIFEGERVGVFNWLVEGLCDFLEGGLRPPAAITDATREYREESDPIGLFLTTCCVITGDPEDVIASKLLGDAFNYHLMERGMTGWKPTTFARQIAVKARQWRHPQTGRQFAKGKASVTQYVGLRMTDGFKRRFNDAPKDHNGRPIGTSEAPDPDSGQNAGS